MEKGNIAAVSQSSFMFSQGSFKTEPKSVCLFRASTNRQFLEQMCVGHGTLPQEFLHGSLGGKASCLSFPPSAIDAQQEHTSFHSVLLFVTDMWKALSVRLQGDLFSL